MDFTQMYESFRALDDPSFWQDAWSLPLLPLAGIMGIVLASSLLAVVLPFRSLMRMSVVDVINRRQG